MRLAISSLAWPREADEAVAGLLRELGVTGIELAPTKVWPRPLEASSEEVSRYRAYWEDQGIRIVALQALLFGRSDLTVFGDPQKRRETLTYLEGMIRLASQLGAGVLVFGSPRNRAVGQRPLAEVEQIALEFFKQLGVAARAAGVHFCIEPNPTAYSCDYVTRTDEGAELVRAVGDNGFGLHLDAGALALNEESLPQVLAGHGDVVRHFHISEPFLAQVGEGKVPHAAMGQALRAYGYGEWVSIEMKQAEDRPVMDGVAQALRFARGCYLAD